MNKFADPASWPRPRARLGFIVPSANAVVEPQYNRHLPKGVTAHIARLRQHVPMSLADRTPTILEHAASLADARCDFIAYHCTNQTMSSGVAGDRTLTAALAQATGRKVGATGSALIAACAAIGARKLVLVTPYNQKSNDMQSTFLSQGGVTVLSDLALDLKGEQVAGAPPEYWVEQTLGQRRADTDAYLLSCANTQTMEIVPELETKLGRPVITSNQAMLWYALRTAGLAENITALGGLFALPLSGLKIGAAAE